MKGMNFFLTLLFLLSFIYLQVSVVKGGQCVFTQSCLHDKLDGPCTSTLSNHTSFSLVKDPGYTTVQETYWDGTIGESINDCPAGYVDFDDKTGHCLKAWPEGEKPSNQIPIICEKYADNGCCSWQQNYALYKNLQILVSTFAGKQGCIACAKNFVDLWCDIVCNDDQASYIKPSNPPPSEADRKDTLNDVMAHVLEVDIYLDPDYVCKLFNSCKSVNIVSQVTAMQTALGLLNFQGQTGAVQYGQYFTFKFSPDDNDESLTQRLASAQERNEELQEDFITKDEKAKQVTMIKRKLEGSAEMKLLYPDVLSCYNFYDPGSSQIPFPYPPPQENIISCPCTYCTKTCEYSSEDKIDMPIVDQPVSPLDGMNKEMVLSITVTVIALLVVTYIIRG